MKFSKEASIGIVIIISITILIWGINFLKGFNIFVQEKTYYAKYDRIDGLKNSSPVTLKGYKIGQIKRIFFSDEDASHIIVEFSVHESFKFRKKSVARIISSDIMGTKEIKIMPGTLETYHHAGDTLFGNIEGDIKEQVSMQMLPLKTKAERLMSSVDSVLSVIQYVFNKNTRENLSKSVTSIRYTIQNLENTSGKLDTLMTNQQGKLASIITNIDSITYNLKNNNDYISNILQNFSSLSDSLSKAQIANTISEVQIALSQAGNVLSKINSGEGTLGSLINNDTLYHNLEDASENLNLLLSDLKKNPKKYVRFSLLDMGRTSSQESDRTRKQIDKEKGVFYRVEILSSKTPVSLNDQFFKKYRNIQELQIDNHYKYTLGYTQNYREILRLLKKVKKDFPNALVVKFASEN